MTDLPEHGLLRELHVMKWNPPAEAALNEVMKKVLRNG